MYRTQMARKHGAQTQRHKQAERPVRAVSLTSRCLCCAHAGWWVWGDAVCVSAVQGEPFQPAYVAPGLVATLAILVMNCVPRSELSDNIYGDDAALVSTSTDAFFSTLLMGRNAFATVTNCQSPFPAQSTHAT